MKAIINGRRWDTEKADLVCKIFEGNRNDFRHIDAGLYCTPRSKSFFLAGYGGAMTIFSKSSGDNTSCGSSKIIPLSREEALEWAERHASAEIIEKYFAIQDADDHPLNRVEQFDDRGIAVITVYPRPDDAWDHSSVNYDLDNLYDLFGRVSPPADQVPFDVIEQVFDQVWRGGGARTIDDLQRLMDARLGR